MEFHLRRRVHALANVTILDNHEMIEPVIAADAVTGTRIINQANNITITLDADLVVDATGRGSRTRASLDSLGFRPPPEDRLAATWGYSSQLMRIAPGCLTERMAYVRQGTIAPGALLIAYENDTWMLAVSCPN